MWKPCLKNPFHLQVPYRQGNLTRRYQRNHSKAKRGEVRTTVKCFFGEIKSYEFVDFT